MTISHPVLVTGHPDIFLHDATVQHCAMEATRISDIYAAVATVDGVRVELSQVALPEQFERVHDRDYLALLADTSQLADGELFAFDRETRMSRHSWRALALSAGGMCQGVDAVLSGHARHAFNVGYAGHHAQADRASGFCFTNPVAIAALHARAQGLERIAVLDIDTHSGNGTVLTLLDKPEFLFAETYQQGYPGSFLPGVRPPHILREKCNKAREFTFAWTRLFEKLKAYGPQLVLVSAGFDAHRADELGLPGLSDEHYRWVADGIAALGAPVVATLEGGYSVADAARCAALFTSRLVAAAQAQVSL